MRDISSFRWWSLFLLVFGLWSVFLLSCRVVEATPSTPLIIEATTFTQGEGGAARQLTTINNNLFRYGHYCGPGPDDSQWQTTVPVDALDVVCQNHDKSYKTCLVTLSQDTGYQIPKLIHQIMAMRGLIAPTFILKWAFRVAPRYMACMHEADLDLVVAFERVIKYNLFPNWWSNPALAPAGTQGAIGYQEACALGMKGKCAVSSRTLFRIMLKMFQKSVEIDTRAAPPAFFTPLPHSSHHHVPSTSKTSTKKAVTATTPVVAMKQNQTTTATMYMESLYLF